MGRVPGELVTARRDGALAWVVIDRPEARNAFNREVLSQLDERLESVARDPEVRVVVITGAGERAFGAGADLEELRGLSGIAARELLGVGHRIFRKVETLGIPSIAAVRGWALGGGFELALSCSVVLAGRSARFGLPEVGLGLMPGYGGTQRLTRAVGVKPALAMMLTGDPIDAERAWELGLLARPPVDDEALLATAAELAGTIATRSPSALQLILEAVDAAAPPDAGLRHEAALGALAISSPDAAEGVSAFLEKRKPSFGKRP